MNQLTLRTLAFVAGAIAAPLATGQCFSDALGSPQNAGDETEAFVSLGFPFTMPGGTVVTDLIVTSNGRIFPSGASSVTFSVDVGEFLGAPTLAPFWVDQDFGSAVADDIYFSTDGVGRAVIQFVSSVEFLAAEPFSYSVILSSDGSFEYQYDNRFVANSGLVGYSDGLGINPGQTDLSLAVAGSALLRGSVAFEEFAGPIDLSGAVGSTLTFLPDGAGGYVISGASCGLAPPLPDAVLNDLGSSCNFAPPAGPSNSIFFFPSGSGGYMVFPDTGVPLDSNMGPGLGVADEDLVLLNLGFDFAMPGGNVVSQVELDSNGRILEVGADDDDFTPSIAEAASANGSSIMAFWTDFNATLGGDAFFWTDQTSRANFTWNSRQFGAPPGSDLLVQLQLDAGVPNEPLDDSWTVVLADITTFNPDGIGLSVDSAIIGCSVGGGAVIPPESDYSAGFFSSGSNPNIYEIFDADAAEEQDLQSGGGFEAMTLAANDPEVGGTWDLSVTNLPASAALGVYGIGFSNLNAPLALIDPSNPCLLITSLDLVALPMNLGGTGADTAPPVPLTGAPAGVPLYAQALVVDPTFPAAVFVITSNGIEGITGM